VNTRTKATGIILILSMTVVYAAIATLTISEKPLPSMSPEAREAYEDAMREEHGFVPPSRVPPFLVILIMVAAWCVTCLPVMALMWSQRTWR
jgi:ribose/xylose/arabinose/galactoside ABC-type transport system permease subunit